MLSASPYCLVALTAPPVLPLLKSGHPRLAQDLEGCLQPLPTRVESGHLILLRTQKDASSSFPLSVTLASCLP